MRYPTIPLSKTDELAVQLAAGERPAIGSAVSWTGAGAEVDLGPLDQAVEAMRQRYVDFLGSGEGGQPEEFEGIAAGELHKALRDLPVEALDDPGFWRFVALDKLWWFIEDREEGPIGRGNHMTYVDGLRPAECVPMRMFLRAQAVGDGDDYGLASSMKRAADFWRSHVIRVRTAGAPPLARGFARLQSTERMPTDEVRRFARRVNRLWTNVVLDRLDDAEADELMRELYDTR
jgi:hypothetical protein